MLEILSLKYLYLILWFIIIYSLGHITLCVFNQKKNFLLYKLVSGVTFVTCLYAAWNSSGITILNLIIVLGVILFFQNLNSKELSLATIKRNLVKFEKDLLYVIIALTIFFLVLAPLLFNFTTEGFNLINEDYSFYARLAGYLRDFGVENTNLEYFLQNKGPISPYHYFDIWLTAAISNLFNLHVQYALILIAYPLLLTCVYYAGVVSISEIRIKINSYKYHFLNYLLPYLLLFLAMFGFLYPNFIDSLKMDIWTPSLFSMPKIVFISLFVILVFISFVKRYFFIGSCLVAIAATGYLTTVPAFFGGMGLFYFYRLVVQKDTFKQTLLYLSPLTLAAIYYYAFYSLLPVKTSSPVNINELLSYYNSFEAIKTIFNITVKAFIQIIITAAPYLVLFLFIPKNIRLLFKDIWLVAFLTVLCSILSWAILHPIHDAVQLWTNLYNSIIIILSFYLLVIFILLPLKNTLLQKLYAVTLVLLMAIFSTSQFQTAPNNNKNYFETLERIKSPNPRFGFIYEKRDYEYVQSTYDQVYAGATQGLMRAFDPLEVVSLSAFNIKVHNELEQLFKEKNTFVKYIKEKKEKKEFISNDQSQIDFIKEYNINYLLIYQQQAVPQHLHPLFLETSIGEIDGYHIYKRR